MRPNQFKLDRFYVTILERFLFNSNKDQKIMGLTSYAIENWDDESNNQKISHEKILKCIKKLYESGLIHKVNREEQNRGTHYDITVFGLISWLSFDYSNDTNTSKINNSDDKAINTLITTHCTRLIPWISKNWTKIN